MQMKIPLKNYRKDFCLKKHQIMQINLVLKNLRHFFQCHSVVQIIQINIVLKNTMRVETSFNKFK